MKKYHIAKNTVQETLVIPLYGRAVCSRHYPDLLYDPKAEEICDSLDYDFASKQKLMESAPGLFGAMEAAQRHYDLAWEVKDYLWKYPEAAVVNLGCGLDTTFAECDNGSCHGYNIDFPDVIGIRDEILPPGERETSIACDLRDHSWMEQVDGTKGAVFFASGVFYYMKKEEVRALLDAIAKHFPGCVIAFDACNRKGAAMMMKTWLKEAGITDAGVYFSLEDEAELHAYSDHFASVTSRSYMRGYRDIYPKMNLLHKLLTRMCDSVVRMKIIKITAC